MRAIRTAADNAGRIKRGFCEAQTVLERLEPRSYLSVTFGSPTFVNNIRGVSAIAAADLNGDGLADMVVTGLSPSSVGAAVVGVYPNQHGSFVTPAGYPVGTSPGAVAIGDFGNGRNDIATVDPSDNQLFVLLNDGSGNFTQVPNAALGGTGGDSSIVAADFGGHGRDDLAVADPTDDQVVIAISNGDGTFALQSPVSVPQPQKVITADFNGDGYPDLAILSGPSSGSLYVALNNGNGSFASPVAYGAGSATSNNDIAAADFNGDAKPDLVAVGDDSSGGGVAAVLLNQGAGTFGSADDLAVPHSARAVVTGTLAGSGHADIAALGQSGSLDVLPGNGDGTFGADQSVFTSELATPGGQAISADFDGNGTPDIAFLSRSQGGFGMALNGVSTSVVTPQLSGKLPTKPVVAGVKIAPIVQTLSFTASATFSGSVSVSLQLVPVSGFGSNATTLTTLTRNLSLRAGRSQRFPISIRSLPSGVSGSYYLFAQLTDSGGAVSSAAAVQPVTIVAPTVDLSGAFTFAPRTAKAGRKGVVGFKVTNSGTITANGMLPMEIFASASGSLDAGAVSLGQITRHVAIGSGKTAPLQALLTLPATAGSYYFIAVLDPQNTLNDVDVSNNVFVSATTISIV